MNNINKDSKWELVDKLENLPKHDKGGVPLSFKDGKVSFLRGNSSTHAKHGLFIAEGGVVIPDNEKVIIDKKDTSPDNTADKTVINYNDDILIDEDPYDNYDVTNMLEQVEVTAQGPTNALYKDEYVKNNWNAQEYRDKLFNNPTGQDAITAIDQTAWGKEVDKRTAKAKETVEYYGQMQGYLAQYLNPRETDRERETKAAMSSLPKDQLGATSSNPTVKEEVDAMYAHLNIKDEYKDEPQYEEKQQAWDEFEKLTGQTIYQYTYANTTTDEERATLRHNETKRRVLEEARKRNAGYYNQGEFKSNDAVAPNEEWMYPQLTGGGKKDMTHFSSEVIAAGLPIPGLNTVGKIPGVLDKVVEGSAKVIKSAAKGTYNAAKRLSTPTVKVNEELGLKLTSFNDNFKSFNTNFKIMKDELKALRDGAKGGKKMKQLVDERDVMQKNIWDANTDLSKNSRDRSNAFAEIEDKYKELSDLAWEGKATKEQLAEINKIQKDMRNTVESIAEYGARESELMNVVKIIDDGTFTLTKEGNIVHANASNPVNSSVNVGEGTMPSFRHGTILDTKVQLPSTTTTFSKTPNPNLMDEVLATAKVDNVEELSISAGYVYQVKDNIKFLEESLPGFNAFGSTTGIADNAFPHLTHDFDGIMTQQAWNKVKDKYPVANVKNRAKYGETINIQPDYKYNPGELTAQEKAIRAAHDVDINIIRETADGKATGKLAEELFRTADPDGFYKAAFLEVKTGNAVKIPYTPDELLEKTDMSIKTIVDAMESARDKHILRGDVYLNYGDVGQVAKAQDVYVKSIVGSKGNIGPQYSTEALSDVAANAKLLDDMEFIGNRAAIANDPKRMQLALNDHYINSTIYSRGTDIRPGQTFEEIRNAFNTWNLKYRGGTANGGGLNAVKLGDSNHGILKGNFQIKPDLDNAVTPTQVFSNINKQTNGTLTLETSQVEDINSILNKYGFKTQFDVERNSMSKIMNSPLMKHGVDDGVSLTIKQQDDLAEALGDISKNINMKISTNGRTYGNSEFAASLNNIDDAEKAIAHIDKIPLLKSKRLRVNTAMDVSTKGQVQSLTNKQLDKYTHVLSNTEKDIADELIGYNNRIRSLKQLLSSKKAGGNIKFKAQQKVFNETEIEIKAKIEKLTAEYKALGEYQTKVNKYRYKLIDASVIGSITAAGGTITGGGVYLTHNISENIDESHVNHSFRTQKDMKDYKPHELIYNSRSFKDFDMSNGDEQLVEDIHVRYRSIAKASRFITNDLYEDYTEEDDVWTYNGTPEKMAKAKAAYKRLIKGSNEYTKSGNDILKSIYNKYKDVDNE